MASVEVRRAVSESVIHPEGGSFAFMTGTVIYQVKLNLRV